MGRSGSINSSTTDSANVGLEQKLWLAADAFRSNVERRNTSTSCLDVFSIDLIDDPECVFYNHQKKALRANASPYRAEMG
jgi:hypothetical protein